MRGPLLHITNILIVTGLLVGLKGRAQTQRYSGFFQTGSLQGVADFEYQVKRNDTIRDGSFRMTGPLAAFPKNQKLELYQVEGHFAKNKPSGRWKISAGQYSNHAVGQVVDRYYQLPLDGREMSLSGTFSKGAPAAIWHAMAYGIDSSEVVDTILMAQVEVGKSHALKNLDLSYARGRIIGRFGRNSEEGQYGVYYYPEDKEEPEEIWWFEEGLFRGIIINSGSESDTLALNKPTGLMDTIWLSLSDNALLLAHALNGFYKDSALSATGIPEGLEQYQRVARPLDSVLVQASKESIPWKVRFPAVKKAFGKGDLQALQRLDSLRQYSRALVDTVLVNSQVQILSRSNEEVEGAVQALNYAQGRLWGPADSLLHWWNAGILSLLPRDKLVQFMRQSTARKTYRKWLNSPVMAGPHDAEVSKYSFSAPDTGVVQGYANLAAHWTTALQDLVQLVNKELGDKRREKALVQLEDSLMEQFYQTQLALDSLIERAPAELDMDWNALRKGLEVPLNEYSSLEKFEAKTRMLEKMHHCFAEMRELIRVIGTSVDKQRQIENIYTRKVWNPYTYTYMEEVVKKHLLNAYRQDLLPDWYNKVEKGFTCPRLRELTATGQNLHQRMLVLRDENTNDLERQLKKTQQVQEMWKLLKIDQRLEPQDEG